MAAIEPERILKRVEAFTSGFIAAVYEPSVGLQQHCRPQVAVGVPPPTWAATSAAEAKDTFIVAIECRPILGRLEPLTSTRRRCSCLQPRLNHRMLSFGLQY